jgi:hypothetical protein
MKKILFFLFIITSINVSAFENFDLRCSLIYFGVGTQRNSPEDYTFEPEFLTVGITHSFTRIGLEYTMAKMWNWFYINTPDGINYEETSRTSLINLGLYWNFFNADDGKTRLSFDVFNKINYLFCNDIDSFHMDEYVYSAGLRFTIMGHIGTNEYYSLFGGEAGYRNVSGQNIFYAAAYADVLGLLVYSIANLPRLLLTLLP